MADREGFDEDKKRKRIDVYVDKEIMPLIPEFLENRQKDLNNLRIALEKGDHETIRTIATNLKGSGGTYGFEAITEFGNAIRNALDENNVGAVKTLIKNLESYLNHIDIKESSLKKICQNCGNIFESKDEDVKLCPQCIVEKQEKIIERTEEKKEKKKSHLKTVMATVTSVLVAAAIVVLIIQLPKILEETKSGKPIRIGTYATDEKTDICIKNLWEISRLLQENKKPDNSLTCPVTGSPYKIEDNMVSCPNPERHGLKALYVSKERKIPEAVK
ncbi:MAG TPA: Hpt domain-containing protein [Syntrophorhabdaceae bacterium]|nr:Hpt domain-containing protein [Syntrophorhabdaceae bacterium]